MLIEANIYNNNTQTRCKCTGNIEFENEKPMFAIVLENKDEYVVTPIRRIELAYSVSHGQILTTVKENFTVVIPAPLGAGNITKGDIVSYIILKLDPGPELAHPLSTLLFFNNFIN